VRDEPWPSHPHMHPEAVEGVLEEDVLAESGFSFEPRAAVGPGKEASVLRGMESQMAKAGS
jgi:hypothetical protein